MKVFQINSVVNSGSTGRITEDIGKVLLAKGYESHIAFGRGDRPSMSHLIRIGNRWDQLNHGLKTALLDRHGFGSENATKALIREIDRVKPDAIGLHNLHGYYLNIEVLFNYLYSINVPVIWTLFDCWAFTGHCSYFDNINCKKWIDGCYSCPKKRKYPSSYVLDNSKKNFLDKKSLFTKHENLHIIVHSKWLKNLVERSFLKTHKVSHIFSGIDLDVFRPLPGLEVQDKYRIGDKKIILGVANVWDTRKGLSDFLSLQKYLPGDCVLVLVGLTGKQITGLPSGIVGIERTESVNELAALYSAANVFVNPTWLDNFPTTNLEALACGSPVVTYRTGGSPEAIDELTGRVVEQGDISALWDSIKELLKIDRAQIKQQCRERAEKLFNKDDRYTDYLSLYEELVRPGPSE